MYSRSRPIHPCLKTLTESKSYEVKSVCVILYVVCNQNDQQLKWIIITFVPLLSVFF